MPRQSHEKLTSDPDYGSYKLTLTSNEDCIHLPNNVFHEQIHPTKINNLPDVLPLGVKMKSVAPRYGSNTNLNMKSMSITSSTSKATSKATSSTSSVNTVTKTTTATTISAQQIIKANGLVGETIKELSDQLPTSPTATTNNNNPLSHIALKSMFNIHNKNTRNSIEHNNMINSNHMNDSISPTKYMSQSTIDLKKAHHLFGNEIIFNHHHHNNNSQSNGHGQRIMSTESVNSLADSTNRQSAPAYFFQQQLQQHNALLRKSYDGNHHLSTLSSNGNLSNGNNLSINTNGLPPLNGKKDDKIIRNDSLKENIDKITQLQSKLMSSHFSDRSKELSQSFSELSMHKNNSMIIGDESTFIDSFKTDLSNVSSDSMAFININNVDIMNQTNVAINSCSPPSSSSSTLSSLSSSTPNSIESNLITKDSLSDATESTAKLNETFTSEVGSQTDEIILDSLNSSLSLNDLPGSIGLSTRAKCAEEIDCEKLADLLIQKLAPTDRLRNILGKF